MGLGIDPGTCRCPQIDRAAGSVTTLGHANANDRGTPWHTSSSRQQPKLCAHPRALNCAVWCHGKLTICAYLATQGLLEGLALRLLELAEVDVTVPRDAATQRQAEDFRAFLCQRVGLQLCSVNRSSSRLTSFAVLQNSSSGSSELSVNGGHGLHILSTRPCG
jgi:hypothetical protein